jgi:hypothetical protein
MRPLASANQPVQRVVLNAATKKSIVSIVRHSAIFRTLACSALWHIRQTEHMVLLNQRHERHFQQRKGIKDRG